MGLREVDVRALPLDGSRSLIGAERAERFESTAATAREFLDGRTVLNVNSTATGGGVAEMLQTLLAYARGAGVDARWVVIEGNPRFFEITKRLHNHLYGTAGDGGPLGAAERRGLRGDAASETSRSSLDVVASGRHRRAARPADRRTGRPRCSGPAHASCGVVMSASIRRTSTPTRVGSSCGPMSTAVDGYVFSCEQFAPSWVPRRAPCRHCALDRSVLGQERSRSTARDVVADTPVRRAARRRRRASRPASFTRRDGSQGRITRHVDLARHRAAAAADAPIVLQASRWDALKDMRGRAARVSPSTSSIAPTRI